MAAKKRILFFADASSVHTQRWVKEIAARGFDCVVATRRPAEVPGAREVVPVRPGGDAAGWLFAIPAVKELARKLAPGWVHGHYVTSYGLWAAVASPGPQLPVVLTAWGSDILVTPRAPGLRGAAMAALVGWSLKRAALVTADAQDVLDEIGRYGTPARRELLLWGADTERFRPTAKAPAGFGIVSLRNWEANYNIATLLRAFAMLRHQRPQSGAVLELLGGGPDAAPLQALAAELALSGAVRFTGRVDDAGMVSALQRARVSVSVPTSDATSVSLLESMACGLAVVASDLPANRAWIEPELLVPAGDADALAGALLRLHDDPALAAAHGQRNRALAAERAARRRQMDRMAVLYDALTLRAPLPPQP